MTRRDEADLRERLAEQLVFLANDAAAYDAGNEAYAKRLALDVRVLVHSKGRSPSLLDQLGILGSIEMWDTISPRPGQFQPEHDSRQQQGWPRLIMLRIPGGFRAPLGRMNGIVRRIPFIEWWAEPIDHHPDGSTSSRSDYVLALAEKEGGAHVDPQIARIRQAIEHDAMYPWQDQAGVGLTGNMVAACVRQIAFELEGSIGEALGRPGASAI